MTAAHKPQRVWHVIDTTLVGGEEIVEPGIEVTSFCGKTYISSDPAIHKPPRDACRRCQELLIAQVREMYDILEDLVGRFEDISAVMRRTGAARAAPATPDPASQICRCGHEKVRHSNAREDDFGCMVKGCYDSGRCNGWRIR